MLSLVLSLSITASLVEEAAAKQKATNEPI